MMVKNLRVVVMVASVSASKCANVKKIKFWPAAIDSAANPMKYTTEGWSWQKDKPSLSWPVVATRTVSSTDAQRFMWNII